MKKQDIPQSSNLKKEAREQQLLLNLRKTSKQRNSRTWKHVFGFLSYSASLDVHRDGSDGRIAKSFFLSGHQNAAVNALTQFLLTIPVVLLISSSSTSDSVRCFRDSLIWLCSHWFCCVRIFRIVCALYDAYSLVSR